MTTESDIERDITISKLRAHAHDLEQRLSVLEDRFLTTVALLTTGGMDSTSPLTPRLPEDLMAAAHDRFVELTKPKD